MEKINYIKFINNKYTRRAEFTVNLNEHENDNRQIEFYISHDSGRYIAGIKLQRLERHDGYITHEYNPFDIISAVITEGRFSVKKIEEYAEAYKNKVCDSMIADYIATNTMDREKRADFANKHLFTILK